jgi:hypothetical protein
LLEQVAGTGAIRKLAADRHLQCLHSALRLASLDGSLVSRAAVLTPIDAQLEQTVTEGEKG